MRTGEYTVFSVYSFFFVCKRCFNLFFFIICFYVYSPASLNIWF